MRFRLLVAATLLASAFAVPAHAADRADPFSQIDALLSSGTLLRGVVREEDVSLLFDHLRAALIASSQGREMPSTEELDRRLEVIGTEMKAQGSLVGLALLAAFEAATRQALRDAFPRPAPR